jgi:hypothetical protein
MDPLKTETKGRIGISTRQDAVEQQATLKAVVIG